MAAKWRRWWRRFRKDFIVDFLDFLGFVWTSLLEVLYTATLPVTHRVFSRKPYPPAVTVRDIRANRIRLNIQPKLSSPFNAEQYEVQWTDVDSNDWQSVGKNELTQRTVARLKPDKAYRFRVQAYNNRGHSGWTEPLTAKTKLEPEDGGGYGPGHMYTWTQNTTEVSITFQLPPGSTKRDIKVLLQPESIRVEHVSPLGNKVLLEGELYNRVQSWDNGSYWELTRDKDTAVLNVTLEKVTKSMAPKFDYWRSVVAGHDEIDTHKIVNENAAEMPTPNMLTPEQMAQMRIPHNRP